MQPYSITEEGLASLNSMYEQVFCYLKLILGRLDIQEENLFFIKQLCCILLPINLAKLAFHSSLIYFHNILTIMKKCTF